MPTEWTKKVPLPRPRHLSPAAPDGISWKERPIWISHQVFTKSFNLNQKEKHEKSRSRLTIYNPATSTVLKHVLNLRDLYPQLRQFTFQLFNFTLLCCKFLTAQDLQRKLFFSLKSEEMDRFKPSHHLHLQRASKCCDFVPVDWREERMTCHGINWRNFPAKVPTVPREDKQRLKNYRLTEKSSTSHSQIFVTLGWVGIGVNKG